MVEILAEQTIEGFSYNSDSGVFVQVITPSPCVLELNKEYVVKWETEEHACRSFLANLNGYEMISVGNTLLAGGVDTGQKFAIAYNPTTDFLNLFALEAGASHVVGIYSVEEETTGVTITLYDRKGKPVTYEGIDRIVVDTPIEDEYAIFTYGEALENSEFEPNFAEGDQLITLEKGELLKEFTIKKPENLISENIVEGVNIAGVEGIYRTVTAPHQLIDGGSDPFELIDDMFNIPPSAIKSSAFYSNPGLANVNLAYVKSIGSSAFTRCYNLETASFAECVSIYNNAFEWCSKLKNISFPECTYIGSYAFSYCSSLTNVDLPNLLDGGQYIFANCVNITNANIGKMTKVARGIFDRCSNLSNIVFPSEMSYFGFYATRETKYYSDATKVSGVVYINNVAVSGISATTQTGTLQLRDGTTCIAESAFYRYSRITSLSIPEVKWINEGAFMSCSSITSVDLPNVLEIGQSAFRSCYKLQSINAPVCEKLGSSVFSYCSVLNTAIFPECKTIGSYAFAGCTKLNNIDFTKCEYISVGAFSNCTSLLSAAFPLCTTILGSAFYNCTSLNTVDIPLCSALQNNLFYSCYSLASVNCPSVQFINPSAFYRCSKLTEIDLPICKTVGSYAFSGCTSLSRVNLPICSSFGSYVFYGCSSLSALILGSTSVCYLPHSSALYSTKIARNTGYIYVPSSLVASYKTASNWRYFSSRISAIESMGV